ncbi:extracellular solute-binding protein [Paenibacillus radicis (ex Xue et al. 2023)]|uniref:Extracellular solute-binding protein n=1 Tax=Paenibacillus radicis (ex Xue et al. 2023) TaxID=2972489 RepID=A0ABT1YEJ9_9BACL|nr:extracellular solute-binding protein [Paenibacillus radicis (ex Xue et al. 2023)]MCR8631614.1 extracellular solute-binding protein [Paenibacillus radicis (ex Xue et al. 2023)]
MVTMKKVSGAALATILACVPLAACSDGSAKNTTAGSEQGKGQASQSAASGSKVSDKLLELSIHFHDGDNKVFKDDFPVFKKAQEMTNVKLHGTAPPSATNSREVFNMMLASGKLPDIVGGLKLDMNKAALDGALEPLDDLIEKHAPNIKKFLQTNKWAKAGSVASDGKLYFIPYIMEGEASEGWYIRQDWLDKLGMKAPKTVDEYYQTLKAFREKDPNGNGKKDEVPYFGRNNKEAITQLVPLFGVRPEWHVINGKVQYGKYLPEYKDAMVNISKWYKEDLIDKEIYTRGAKAREVLLGDNVGGATHDWFPSSATYNDTLKDKIQGFKFVVMAPVADKNGKVWQEYSRMLLRDKGWGIASTSKNKVEVIKYFDFWFTPEGRRLMNFGIEGVQYDMKDGKPIFKPEVLNGKEPVNKQLWDIGAQLDIGYQMDLSYETQWTNPIANTGIKMYIDNKYFAPQFPSVSFTPKEEKTISEKWPAIDTYIREMQQKWVMGAEAVEPNYDKYLKRLKEMGMDDIVKIYQDAYERYQKNA